MLYFSLYSIYFVVDLSNLLFKNLFIFDSDCYLYLAVIFVILTYIAGMYIIKI